MSWSKLTKSAEAAVAAQTLQLVQHSYPVTENISELSTAQVYINLHMSALVVQTGNDEWYYLLDETLL